jgi:hypothetical protein
MEREGLYHVRIRSTDGKGLFPEKSKDRERFLKLLKKARISGDLRVYAYCLLPNDIQILCACKHTKIYKILASVEGVYRNFCLSKYRDKSPVWDHAVDECGWEGLIDMVRYVHRAPRRDSKRKRLQYRWSSHREYLARDDNWVDYGEALSIYGKKERMAVKRYKRFVQNPTTERPASFFYLTEDERREADRPEAPARDTGSPVQVKGANEPAVVADEADDLFVSEEDAVDTGPIAPSRILAVTAELMGVALESLRAGEGGPKETAARRVALYVLREEGRLTNAETGQALGMAASTVSKIYNNAAQREVLRSRIDLVKQTLRG